MIYLKKVDPLMPDVPGKTMDLLSALSCLTTRKTGSKDNARAREMITEAMAKAGEGRFILNPECFDVDVCQDIPARVTRGDQCFEAQAIDYTGCEQAQATGEFIYLYDGQPWQYWFRRAQGRIVVCDFHILNHRILQIKRALEHGAAGIILVSGHKEHLQAGTGIPAYLKGIGIPAVVIRKKDWALIRQSPSTEVTICMQSVIEPKKGMNLIFDLAGEKRDKTIVIGAHYDAWFGGAQDNASGVALLAGMAGVLARRDLQHNLRLIFFDAEELGMVGSRHHLKTPHRDYRFYLNLEMPLPVKKTRLQAIFTSIHIKAWFSWSVARMISCGFIPVPLPLYGFYVQKDMCFPSDVDAFFRRNIPCATSFCHGPDYHTPADTAQGIREDLIPSITRMFCDYVETLDRY
ncbi:MAG: M28 family peptidase [Candidatus Omnitrophota bacterium]